MGAKSPWWANQLLAHLFTNADVVGVGDNLGLLGSSTIGNLYVSLHTSDPSLGADPSDQNTAEISYTGYLRVPVARTKWTVTLASVSPVDPIVFPVSAGGTGGTATYFGIGTRAIWIAGPAYQERLLYSGLIVPRIVVVTGVTPILTTETVTTEA